MKIYDWKEGCIQFYCIDFCSRMLSTPGMIPFRHRDCKGCRLLNIYEINGGFDA